MKINIIVTTFNRSKSLIKTLKSIEDLKDIKQHDVNVIVIDNNSRDDTKCVVEKFISSSQIPFFYYFESRQGKTHALNAAFKKADGDILAFTDDDVLLDKNWINVIAYHFKNSKIVCLTGKIIPVGDDQKPPWYSDRLATVTGKVDVSDQFCKTNNATGANMAIRFNILKKIGGFSHYAQLINEDTLISQKLLQYGWTIDYDPEMIVYHFFQLQRYTKKYFYKWYYSSGRTIAEIHTKDEAALKKKLFSIPFWRWRQCFSYFINLIRNIFHEKKRFYFILQLMRFKGFCYQRWFGLSKIKIAFVNTEFLPIPPVQGGAVEEWIEQIAQHLNRFEVFIFSKYDIKLIKNEIIQHRHYYHFQPKFLSKLLLCSYKLPFKNGNSNLFYFPYTFWCATKLIFIRPDIIHIHNRPQFVKILRFFNPQAKILLHFHQISAMETKIMTPNMLKKVDIFFGCSQFIVNELRKKYTIPLDKTRVAYNAIELKQFPLVQNVKPKTQTIRNQWGISSKDICILYVGRLAENKGVHLLINAVKSIIQEGESKIKLLLCGARGYANRETTPYIQNLYDSTQTIQKHVIFAGYVAHNKIHQYYQAADLVVIPSEVAEGFCIITIESMATGIPIIASAKGGIPEIINNEDTGLLVPHPTSHHFKEKIVFFLKNREKMQSYTKKARKVVEEKFTWDKISQDIENIYWSVLDHAQN